jgi:hypothetical protein
MILSQKRHKLLPNSQGWSAQWWNVLQQTITAFEFLEPDFDLEKLVSIVNECGHQFFVISFRFSTFLPHIGRRTFVTPSPSVIANILNEPEELRTVMLFYDCVYAIVLSQFVLHCRGLHHDRPESLREEPRVEIAEEPTTLFIPSTSRPS